jgi:hypothetical protein
MRWIMVMSVLVGLVTSITYRRRREASHELRKRRSTVESVLQVVLFPALRDSVTS